MYVPDALNVTIVLSPKVVTVGLSPTVPEYLLVGIDSITAPEPPAAPAWVVLFGPCLPPPPPPVLAPPAAGAVEPCFPLAPPPP